MRILITGGEGQLAADIERAFSDHDVLAMGRASLDITSTNAIDAVLAREAPDVVINTAAFHRVDLCESEPEASFLVNAAAPQRLARACDHSGALFVHFSTDYVFDGRKGTPYVEDDAINPLSVYGASKAAGEMATRCTAPRHLIIRTTGVFGIAGTQTSHGNFVETMLRLAERGDPVSVVCDQILTPTYAHDLAVCVRGLIDAGARGTVHVTGSGECSWYEFAAEIFRVAGSQIPLTPIAQADRPTPAARPAYSVLAHERLAEYNVPDVPDWKHGLTEYMAKRKL